MGDAEKDIARMDELQNLTNPNSLNKNQEKNFPIIKNIKLLTRIIATTQPNHKRQKNPNKNKLKQSCQNKNRIRNPF